MLFLHLHLRYLHVFWEISEESSFQCINCTDPETHNLRKSLKGSSFGAEKRKRDSSPKWYLRKQQNQRKVKLLASQINRVSWIILALETRMHSSRMRTTPLLTVWWSGTCRGGCTLLGGGCTCLGGRVPDRGWPVQMAVSVQGLYLPSGVYLPRGVCTYPGGVPAQGVYLPREGGVPARGVYLARGVSATPLWTDRHLWKHNLRKLRLREVKIAKWVCAVPHSPKFDHQFSVEYVCLKDKTRHFVVIVIMGVRYS